MKRMTLVATAAVVALLAAPAMAQKNYTDGGDLYGGSHTTKAKPSSPEKGKEGASKAGNFDPYTDGVRTKSNAAPAKKLPDERPQPDDVARSGKFDPYTDGQSK